MLGVDAKEARLFGKTSAYYGTVEQQGRLTLHLHMVLWICSALTPKEIRDKLMSEDSEFQKRMVEYLESSHHGEFMNGSHQETMCSVSNRESLPGYVNPLEALPTAPPSQCNHPHDDDCDRCATSYHWWREYETMVDNILLKSNMHHCKLGRCYNTGGSCKARFPRDTFENTMLDPEMGALTMKKGESDMNTFSYVIAFLLCCNHDVTSLFSGTVLKAVVAYITEYITKTGLKTYQIFDVIKSVFDRNDKMYGGNYDRQENAQKLMTQVVNAVTSKMEMDAPMAAMYLLGNPDHYTSHLFVACYWRSYTCWVMSQWEPDVRVDNDEEELDPDMVLLRKKGNHYITQSTVDYYKFRPREYDDVPLYTWVRLMVK